jgi:hypothetical protein
MLEKLIEDYREKVRNHENEFEQSLVRKEFDKARELLTELKVYRSVVLELEKRNREFLIYSSYEK